MQDFKNLIVWQKSHKLTLDIYQLTKGFPNDEKFGLTNQMRRSSASIPTNIAEGCGRGTDVDFARFLQISMGSASELEYQLILAKDLGYLDQEMSRKFQMTVNEIKRMLTGLIKKLRR
ncbi:MAG: four helix bundle protein [Chloroflexota bacterium]